VLYWRERKVEMDKNIVRRDYKRMNEQEFSRLVKIRLDRVTDDNIDNIVNNAIIKSLDLVSSKNEITVKHKWQTTQ